MAQAVADKPCLPINPEVSEADKKVDNYVAILCRATSAVKVEP